MIKIDINREEKAVFERFQELLEEIKIKGKPSVFDNVFLDLDYSVIEGRSEIFSTEAQIPGVIDAHLKVSGKQPKDADEYVKNLDYEISTKMKKFNEDIDTSIIKRSKDDVLINNLQFDALMEVAYFYIQNSDMLNKTNRISHMDAEFLSALAFNDKSFFKKNFGSFGVDEKAYIGKEEDENGKVEKIYINAYLPTDLILFIRRKFGIDESEKDSSARKILLRRMTELNFGPNINKGVLSMVLKESNKSRKSYQSESTEIKKYTKKDLIYREYDPFQSVYSAQAVVYFKRSGHAAQPKTDIFIPLYQFVDNEIFWVGDLKVSIKKENYRGLEGGNLDNKIKGIFRGYKDFGYSMIGGKMVEKIVEFYNQQYKNNDYTYGANDLMIAKKSRYNEKTSLYEFYKHMTDDYSAYSDQVLYMMYKFIVGEAETYDSKTKTLDVEANSFMVLRKEPNSSIKTILENTITIMNKIDYFQKDKEFENMRKKLMGKLSEYSIDKKILAGKSVTISSDEKNAGFVESHSKRLITLVNSINIKLGSGYDYLINFTSLSGITGGIQKSNIVKTFNIEDELCKFISESGGNIKKINAINLEYFKNNIGKLKNSKSPANKDHAVVKEAIIMALTNNGGEKKLEALVRGKNTKYSIIMLNVSGTKFLYLKKT